MNSIVQSRWWIRRSWQQVVCGVEGELITAAGLTKLGGCADINGLLVISIKIISR